MFKKLFLLATLVIAGTAYGGPASAAGHRHSRTAHLAGRFAQVLRLHGHGAAHGRGERRRIAGAGLSHVEAASAAGALTGRASFYGGGGRTASGGTVGAATCAHRWLPFGTRVLVTNLANLKQAVLTVNDRGPFVHGRLIDVSHGAAAVLGMLQVGVATVRMEVIGARG